MILPKEFLIDNVIVSGNQVKNTKKSTGITYTIKGNLYAKVNVLNWMIVKRAVGHRIETDSEDDMAPDLNYL